MDGGVDSDDEQHSHQEETTAPGAVGAAPDNKFQRAIGAWRNIDLTSLLQQLDKVAADIVDHQRDTLTQRKDLAQKTKDFRKQDDASKLNDIKGLLKSYQSFIDVISNQSKTVQAAFFQVYSPLSEAPDPYPLLEASVDSLVTAEETLPKVTSENQHLQKAVAKLTAQLEETEKKLEEEAASRKALEDARDAKIKEVEASWSAVLSEKEDNWTSKEKSLEEKVESQEKLLKELKASYEVAQRLGRGEEVDEDAGRGATAAELEFVSSELERTSHRLADVEARNEQLRLELAQSASANATEHVPVEDDPAFLRLRSENSSLLRKLENARFERDSQQSRLETDVKTMKREVESLKSEKEALREKVQKWSDYENVKQELEVLKSIEFSTGDDDEDPTDLPSPQNGTATKGKETLEQLLLARNKKLGNELTVLRVSHQDLQNRLETLQDELSNANMELEKSRALNETLEADLEKVQKHASNAFDSSGMSVAGTYTSRYPQSSYGGTRRGRAASPTSSIISGWDPAHASPNLSLTALRGGETAGGGSGILPMVTAQRDRFKKRNAELEAELQKTHEKVSALRSEIAALQKDNLDLYEKTRYVSSYNRSTGTSASAAYNNGNPSTIHVSDDTSSGLTMDRYKSTYESNLSPFQAFRGRESQRVLKRMNIFEKMVFRVTKLVMATRTSRNLFALYCVGLHLMVFFMLLGEMGSHSVVPVAGPVAAPLAGMGDAGGPLEDGSIPGRVDG